MQCTTKKYVEYVHVDNGGYSLGVEIDETPGGSKIASIKIEDGYFGYSSHQISLNENVTPDVLRRIGAQFIIAANALEKQ